MGGKDVRGGVDDPWWMPFPLPFLIAVAPLILLWDLIRGVDR